MMFSFHPEAEEEFEAAVAWYEERDTGLGLDFAAEVREAVRLAQSMPHAWPKVEESIRRFWFIAFLMVSCIPTKATGSTFWP